MGCPGIPNPLPITLPEPSILWKSVSFEKKNQRGENTMSCSVREATPSDLTALVPLHLKTWRDTYEDILSEQDLNGPTYEIRERQWRSNFQTTDGSWFCFVVEDE